MRVATILRTPGVILGLGTCSNADDTDENSQHEQQEPHSRLLVLRWPSAINVYPYVLFQLTKGRYLRMNLSKHGVSYSFGGRGMWFTVGPHGRERPSAFPSRVTLSQLHAATVSARLAFHMLNTAYVEVFRNPVAVGPYRSHMRAGEVLSFHNRQAPNGEMSDDDEVQPHLTSGGPSYFAMDGHSVPACVRP